MSLVKFTSTKLANKGKKGILTPDSDGYYTIPVGGLNAFNSVGQYYTLEGAKELFQGSSTLIRRIQNGCLKGELGHPKKAPGMSNDDYINRILTVEETNVCCHYKEVWLDEEYGKKNPELNNPKLVGVMAKIKPSGPHADALKASLENQDENVCFSVRAFTEDYYQRGQCFRILRNLVTWDNVTEPGINHANKWMAPSLESDDLIITTLDELENIRKSSSPAVAVESREFVNDCIRSVSTLPSIPIFTKW